MKHSDINKKNSGMWRGVAIALMWVVPVLLLLPNLVLNHTETSYSTLARTINILLPLGIYLLLCASSRKVGRTILLLVPVMVLAAFQIVLLFLYGESLIAIDMFLNVATTSINEAGELLANLTTAIITVCCVYAPAIIIAIVLVCKHTQLEKEVRLPALYTGASLATAGIICLIAALFSSDVYRPERQLFPVNAVYNMAEAIHRTSMSNHYVETARGYRYHSVDTRDAAEPEIYVLVIGETSRAGNWQLNGYPRHTNPRLSQRRGLISCTRALSESNTTHKSVPLLMSHFDSKCFGDSVYCSKGIINAFEEAGYETAFLSNQARNHSLIDFFGEEADAVEFMHDDGKAHFDTELANHLQNFVDSASCGKRFIVLHTYGSHFNYKERYPENYKVFNPDNSSVAYAENRDGLMNAYDNSILFTDTAVDSFIEIIATTGAPAAVVYVADHGEDIFDDERGRFLHASPTPTYWQLHVPMVIWMSDAYRAEHPDKFDNMLENSGKNISSSRSAFHTLLSLAGVQTPAYEPEAAITEKSYKEPNRLYLNDYNEAVPLTASGLRHSDFAHLAKARVSY